MGREGREGEGREKWKGKWRGLPSVDLTSDYGPVHRPARRSGLVLSASDCGVMGPRFESHCGRLCLSR